MKDWVQLKAALNHHMMKNQKQHWDGIYEPCCESVVLGRSPNHSATVDQCYVCLLE